MESLAGKDTGIEHFKTQLIQEQKKNISISKQRCDLQNEKENSSDGFEEERD